MLNLKYMKYKICCLIPVKKNSKRLKNKNFLKIGKKNIFQIALNKAKRAKIFDEIFISTDNKKIIHKGQKNIIFINRPKHLCKDPATITDVMLHTCEYFKIKNKKFDLMFVLSVTNPFFDSKDIKKSLKSFLKNNSDGLLTISEFSSPPFNAWYKKNKKLTPVFTKSKFKFTKSTECPKTFFSNGAVRIVKIKKFLKTKSFHKLKLSYYETQNYKSIDIDTKFEYKLANCIQKYGPSKLI